MVSAYLVRYAILVFLATLVYYFIAYGILHPLIPYFENSFVFFVNIIGYSVIIAAVSFGILILSAVAFGELEVPYININAVIGVFFGTLIVISIGNILISSSYTTLVGKDVSMILLDALSSSLIVTGVFIVFDAIVQRLSE